MLVRDQYGWTMERSLAQHSACGRSGEAAQCHREITTSREDIDRVNINEAATVISNIDHNSVLRIVFGIEIDVQLVQRVCAHIKHVRVAESSITYARHV